MGTLNMLKNVEYESNGTVGDENPEIFTQTSIQSTD